ncbi:MAG TPA: hypothetical protein VKA95_08000 [Nitrososphaeraceae archaeon]|nr:hypothetical protein [Nitrososphaeraceae archaeon]
MQISISKIEKKYHIYLFIIIMGASIYTSVMVLPSNAAAITTLDSLESESNRIGQNIPHFDVGESARGIAVDEYDHIAYVANGDSNTV